MQLNWLPVREDWDALLRSAASLPAAEQAGALRALATSRMEFAETLRLDRTLGRMIAANRGALPGLEPVRLAVLGSSTTSHLAPGIRVAGLRRGLLIEVYVARYGVYWQELMDPASALHAFAPQALLLALDARHVATANAGGDAATPEAALDLMRGVLAAGAREFRLPGIAAGGAPGVSGADGQQ